MTYENDTIELTSVCGGELGDMIDKLSGEEFQCTCNHEFELGQEDGFVGYPHEGGLKDITGIKWWLYTKCPRCEYQWAWHKIESRLRKSMLGVL